MADCGTMGSMDIFAVQVGSFVPADSLQLSPVDAIFVRMGARDHILSNQSTFFVELSETAGMLRKATKHSLVSCLPDS